MKYIAPEMELMLVLAADVITSSQESFTPGNDQGDATTPEEEL